MKLLLTQPLALPLALLLALGACGQKETEAQKSSFGAVLPGSASDAMLPYDTATSAPPLEAPDAGPASEGAASGGGNDAVVPDREPDAEPEPVAS